MHYTIETQGGGVDLAHSRRQFLKGTGVAALLALTTPRLAGTARSAGPTEPNLQDINDTDVLNFELVLEHVTAGFGTEATGGNLLSSRTAPYFRAALRNATARGEALTTAIRSADPSYQISEPQASYNFGEMDSETALLVMAKKLGSISIGGYAWVAPLFKNKAHLALSGASAQGGAREFAAYRYLSGEVPSPAAFSVLLTTDEVRDQLAPILGT